MSSLPAGFQLLKILLTRDAGHKLIGDIVLRRASNSARGCRPAAPCDNHTA